MRVRGFCPVCGTGLHATSEGFLVCSSASCPQPDAATLILEDRETEHVVTFTEDDFTVRHPLRERLHGQLDDCQVHRTLRELAGPPQVPGRYRVYLSAPTAPSAAWVWEQLS